MTKSSVLVACFLFTAFSGLLAIAPDLTAPPAAFGDADRDGSLIADCELRFVDFGDGLRLPVRWVFRSADRATNPYGWDGFSLTVLEAKAVKKSESLWEITLLCGKKLYFSKSTTTSSGQWKSNDDEWTAVEAGDKFTITRWDGWELEYDEGRIRRLRTEDNRTLRWDYDSTDERLVTRVIEPATNNAALEIGISDNPVELAGSSAVRGAHTLRINGDLYTFKYASNTLNRIEFPDGRKVVMHFEDAGHGGNRLTLTDEEGFWKSWVYDSVMRLLRTDGVWNYRFVGTYIPPGRGQVPGSYSGSANSTSNSQNSSGYASAGSGGALSNPLDQREQAEQPTGGEQNENPTGGETGDVGGSEPGGGAASPTPSPTQSPSSSPTPSATPPAALPDLVYDRPLMERTRDSTGEIESVSYEAANSITVSKDVLGNQTKRYAFKTKGKLYEKPFKIERKKAGEIEFKVIWLGSYDAATGDLLRVHDAAGNETAFAYERFSGASDFLPPKKVITTDPMGRNSVIERDLQGNIIKVTSPTGVETRFEYDARRRLSG